MAKIKVSRATKARAAVGIGGNGAPGSGVGKLGKAQAVGRHGAGKGGAGAGEVEVAPQHLVLRCDALRLDMTILMGETPPTITDGLGGYTAQERARDVAMSRWDGVSMLKMDVALLLDGVKRNKSQSQRLSNLKQLGRNRKDPGTPPPPFRLYGPFAESGVEWVLESMEFGEAEYNEEGILVRQSIVLHCQEWVSPDVLKIYNKRKRKKGKGSSAKNFDDRGLPGPLLAKYTVKKGDTLRTIAAHFYKDGDKWTIIGKANDIRDPHNIKPGEVLKIPEP